MSVSYKVIGIFPIVDAESDEHISAPNVVRLDPEKTNIPALIQAGHLEAEPVKTTPKKS